jgi:hypothetical protein
MQICLVYHALRETVLATIQFLLKIVFLSKSKSIINYPFFLPDFSPHRSRINIKIKYHSALLEKAQNLAHTEFDIYA